MDLSIIIVNWNSLDYVRECVGSIFAHTHGINFEIIVVDNASPEGGVEELRQEYPAITVLESILNLGFAGANNHGFAHAASEHVLFLNPDTVLVNPAVNILLAHLRANPNFGVVGGKLLNSDGSVQTESIQRFPTILNQVLDLEYLRLRWPHWKLWSIAPLFEEPGPPLRVDVIPGACMMLRRDVFEAAGRFSTDYFMYAEDIDLNYKVSRLGLGSYYAGEAVIIHHGGRSSSQQRVSQWATRMKFNAMRKLFRKMRGPLYASAYRVALGAASVGRLLVLAILAPMAINTRRRERLLWAASKWITVLRCAVGIDGPPAGRATEAGLR